MGHCQFYLEKIIMQAITETLRNRVSIIDGNLSGGLRPVSVLTESELVRPGDTLESVRPYSAFFSLVREAATRFGCEAVDVIKITVNKKMDGVSTGLTEYEHTVQIKRRNYVRTGDFLNAIGCITVRLKDKLLGMGYKEDVKPNTTGDTLAELLIAARNSVEAEYQRRIDSKLR